MSTTTLENTINQILRNASLSQLQSFTREQQATLREMDPDLSIGQVLSDQVILMAISGDDLRITFKMHYKQGDTQKLLRHGREDDLVSERQKLTDYMKELNNQICGKVCREFARQKITLGMSIPLKLRGFYEAYSDYTIETSPLLKFADCWKITADFGAIFITTYVEISNAGPLRNLRSDMPEKRDQGMEFL